MFNIIKKVWNGRCIHIWYFEFWTWHKCYSNNNYIIRNKYSCRIVPISVKDILKELEFGCSLTRQFQIALFFWLILKKFSVRSGISIDRRKVLTRLLPTDSYPSSQISIFLNSIVLWKHIKKLHALNCTKL